MMSAPPKLSRSPITYVLISKAACPAGGTGIPLLRL